MADPVHITPHGERVSAAAQLVMQQYAFPMRRSRKRALKCLSDTLELRNWLQSKLKEAESVDTVVSLRGARSRAIRDPAFVENLHRAIELRMYQCSLCKACEAHDID